MDYIYIRRNKIIEEINISLPIEDDIPPGRFHRKISWLGYLINVRKRFDNFL